MDWTDLEFFTAAAEEPSFSRAAARLNITHPAMSQRIGRMERRLRVRLFERNAKGVQLTGAGAELLPRAQEMLALRREAELALQSPGPLRPGTTDAVAPLEFGTVELRSHRLVPFLERTLKRRLDWVTDTTPVLVDQVMSGQLGSALCAQFPGDTLAVPPGGGVMTVAHDPIWIMMSARDAEERSEVRLAELRDKTWIVSPPSQHPHAWETAVVAELGARWVGTAQHPGEELIANGDAVAFGSALVRDTDRIAMVPPAPPLSRHLYLLWGPKTTMPDGMRLGAALLEYYRAQAHQVAQVRDVKHDYTGGKQIELP